jgi:putative spermidine/putrescine transport system substrate-binding protein
MGKKFKALLAGCAAMLWAGSAMAEEVVIAGWSGGYDQIFEQDLLKDFLKENNITIRWVLGGSVSNVSKIAAQQANPEIDIALIDDLPQNVAKKQGLWAPFDISKVPNLDKIEKTARLPDDEGVSFAFNVSGLIYQPEVFKEKGFEPPTSWKDLLDPKYKGRVVLFPVSVGEGLISLIAFAKMRGGDEKNIEPGFEMAKEAAANVLEFLGNAGTVGALLQSKEAWISVAPLDLATISKAKGVPMEFVMPEEGSPLRSYTISLVKGAKNADTAQKVVNALLSAEVQSKLAASMQLIPVSTEVKQSDEATSYLKKMYPVDVEHINANRDAWGQTWNREVQSN